MFSKSARKHFRKSKTYDYRFASKTLKRRFTKIAYIVCMIIILAKKDDHVFLFQAYFITLMGARRGAKNKSTGKGGRESRILPENE